MNARTSILTWATLVVCLAAPAPAASLTVELQNDSSVIFVGAVNRWDADGNPRRAVDPKAKLESPAVDATATRTANGCWRFENLAPGRYDLVILTRNRVRIEGCDFPPVLEFDPFFDETQSPDEKTRQVIAQDIARSPHFENKVRPLFFAGDERQVRVLMQLLRDEPTSYDAEFGQPVAVLRHEVWQYTNRYGTWTKEKRTRVVDRLLAAKQDLRQWTWIWEPALGGLTLSHQAATVQYRLPEAFDPAKVSGLLPY